MTWPNEPEPDGVTTNHTGAQVTRLTASKVESIPSDRPPPPSIRGRQIVVVTYWSHGEWKMMAHVASKSLNGDAWVAHVEQTGYVNITVITVPGGGE